MILKNKFIENQNKKMIYVNDIKETLKHRNLVLRKILKKIS